MKKFVAFISRVKRSSLIGQTQQMDESFKYAIHFYYIFINLWAPGQWFWEEVRVVGWRELPFACSR